MKWVNDKLQGVWFLHLIIHNFYCSIFQNTLGFLSEQIFILYFDAILKEKKIIK